MFKQKNKVIRNLIWFLLISIVLTSVFSVDVKAETLEDNTEIVETIEAVDDVAETTESEDLADSPETAALTESETDEVLSEEATSDSETISPENTVASEESTSTETIAEEPELRTEETTVEQETSTEETAAEESEAAEQPAPTEVMSEEQQESAKEESATAESNEDAQSDETKDSPAQSRSSRQSQVTRYIYANSIIRNAPNGTPITTLKMPLFVQGTIEGAWLKFTYNGATAYVANSVTTTNNPPITGYAKTNINVRSFPGRDVIGTVIRGDQVKGVLVGDWVKFTYNGSTGYVYVPLLQDSPIEQRSVYIKAGSNLRKSPNGQVAETLEMPIYADANVAGNWLYFKRNNQMNYVYNSNTQTEPLTVTGYLTGDTDAYIAPNVTSVVFYTLPIGMEISGTMNGNWVKFYYPQRGCSFKYFYIQIEKLCKDPIIQVRYAKSDTNLRNYKNLNHITGIMSRGDFIKGRVIGDYIIENKNGIDMAVYRHILSETPITYAGYVIPNTNVRSAPNGSVLGKYTNYTYVSGIWQDNWLKVQYQGQTGYVYRSQLRRNTPDQFVTNQTSFIGVDGTVVEGTPLTYGEMEQFLDLINQHRKNNGAAPLAYDYNWLEGGNIRAAEITYEFSHTRPDGSSWDTAVPTGYSYAAGENIAKKHRDVEAVFEGWKNSPSHNSNMLRSYFDTMIFTGITLDNGLRTWVTIFGKIKDSN
ncbi:MAG: CAP domain-containing protein [Saccharofermentanales bacterium]|jgi:uncharacterized protein YkwD/outer membrane biosynthesis protein TonB